MVFAPGRRNVAYALGSTRPSITLLSEIEMDLTPSYPHFTPFNPATLGLTSPRTPSQPPWQHLLYLYLFLTMTGTPLAPHLVSLLKQHVAPVKPAATHLWRTQPILSMNPTTLCLILHWISYRSIPLFPGGMDPPYLTLPLNPQLTPFPRLSTSPHLTLQRAPPTSIEKMALSHQLNPDNKKQLWSLDLSVHGSPHHVLIIWLGGVRSDRRPWPKGLDHQEKPKSLMTSLWVRRRNHTVLQSRNCAWTSNLA